MGFARRLFLLDLCLCLLQRFFLCGFSRSFTRFLFHSCPFPRSAAFLGPLFLLGGHALPFTSFRLGSLLGFGCRFQAGCLTRLCICQGFLFSASLCFSFRCKSFLCPPCIFSGLSFFAASFFGLCLHAGGLASFGLFQCFLLSAFSISGKFIVLLSCLFFGEFLRSVPGYPNRYTGRRNRKR
jgi:hypothetical protein